MIREKKVRVEKMFDLFKKLRRKKIKSKNFIRIDKNNIENFLKEVAKSVDANFSGQESIKLQKYFEQEFNAWLKQTIFAGRALDPNAVKLGVVLGLKEALRKINEAEEQERTVSYIN